MQTSTKEQLEHITTLHKQIKQKPLKKGKARKTNWMEPLSGRSFCTPTNGETPVSCVAPDPLSGIDPSPAVVCVYFVESSFRTACARPARIFSFTTSDGDEPDLAELATSSTHLVENAIVLLYRLVALPRQLHHMYACTCSAAILAEFSLIYSSRIMYQVCLCTYSCSIGKQRKNMNNLHPIASS